MRRVPIEEIETDFEREICWGDDERYLHSGKPRKASVFGHFLRLDAVLALVARFSPGPRVADLACAQGNFGLLLAERGYDVTAVDIQPEFLKYALKKHTHGTYRTALGSVMDYRATTPFDCVLLGEIIEHVAHPERLLASAAANLKSGGVLILTTPNGAEYGSGLPTYSQVMAQPGRLEELIPKQFHWGDHLFLYTENELRDLLGHAGFDTLEVQKLNSSYVSQLKGVRYLLPLSLLKWMERRTRYWRKRGADSANSLIVVARKR